MKRIIRKIRVLALSGILSLGILSVSALAAEIVHPASAADSERITGQSQQNSSENRLPVTYRTEQEISM